MMVAVPLRLRTKSLTFSAMIRLVVPAMLMVPITEPA